MIVIQNLNQTEYKLLKDHCISHKQVSTVYRAAHRKRPLSTANIKVKIIDCNKFPELQKEKYPRLMKKILLNNIRQHYQNIHHCGELPQSIFKLYRSLNQQTHKQKDLFYVLNQYHKGEQLRKCILKNNECLEKPQNVQYFGKQLLWNMLKGGGIQMFIYTSTNTIIDDMRLLVHINSISTTGLLFVQSILDSLRKLQNANKIKNNGPTQIQKNKENIKNLEDNMKKRKQQLQVQKKKSTIKKNQQKEKRKQLEKEKNEKKNQDKSILTQKQKSLDDEITALMNQNLSITTRIKKLQSQQQKDQKSCQQAQRKNRQLQKKLKEAPKIIQTEQKYIKSKTMPKQQFLQIYPFLHKDILELSKSQAEANQKFLKQKIRNFAALYLMMITRKDLNFQEMDNIQKKTNDLKQFSLSLVKDKLNLLSKCYEEFLLREKAKQRIMQYEKHLNFQKDTLMEFFKNILVYDNFKFLNGQNNEHVQQNKERLNYKNFSKCWKRVYEICGFINKNDKNYEQLKKLFEPLHQILFQIQPNKHFYEDLGITDSLFYLPVKFNINFNVLTAQNKLWYSCFQENTFSTQAMRIINRIKTLVAIYKQKRLAKIPQKVQIAMTDIRTKYYIPQQMKESISIKQYDQLCKQIENKRTKQQKEKLIQQTLQKIRKDITIKLKKTNPILQYFNKYESKFFIQKKEIDIVVDDKLEHVTQYIPTETYISNFSYLFF